VGVTGHLLVDGIAQGIEQKSFGHGSGTGQGGANLSQAVAFSRPRRSC
jgi:hypothetical protein